MIIQGSNNPLTIIFDADVSSMEELVVTLWSSNAQRQDRMLKMWNQDSMTIQGDTAICPITEREQASWPSEKLIVEAKGLNNGSTVFWAQYEIDVLRRRDRVIKLTQEG